MASFTLLLPPPPFPFSAEGIKLYQQLENGMTTTSAYRLYTKDKLPERWHYAGSKYVLSLVLVTNAGKKGWKKGARQIREGTSTFEERNRLSRNWCSTTFVGFVGL